MSLSRRLLVWACAATLVLLCTGALFGSGLPSTTVGSRARGLEAPAPRLSPDLGLGQGPGARGATRVCGLDEEDDEDLGASLAGFSRAGGPALCSEDEAWPKRTAGAVAMRRRLLQSPKTDPPSSMATT